MQRQNLADFPASGDGGCGDGFVRFGHALDAQAEGGVDGCGVREEVFGYEGVEVVF